MALANRSVAISMYSLRFRSGATCRFGYRAPAHPSFRTRSLDIRAQHATQARSYPTSSSSGSHSSLFGFPPAFLRRSLEAMVPVHDFKVAGVTFEGRQELVASMQEGDPVMLVRQPWNQYDNRAVVVRTIIGEVLGYVPRTSNEHFQDLEFMFGQVTHVGQEPSSEHWGMRVAAQPALMPASASPFYWGNLIGQSQAAKLGTGSGGSALPVEAVEGMLALKRELGDARWHELVKEAVTVSKGLCAVTGASEEVAPLLMVPEWQFDDSQRRVLLRCLNLVSHDVALAHFALDVNEEGQQQACQVLTTINRWGPTWHWGQAADVAEQHLEAMHNLRQEVRDYRMDLTTKV